MKNKIEDLVKVAELLFGKEYDELSPDIKEKYKEILFLIDRYYDTFFSCMEIEGKIPPYRLEEYHYSRSYIYKGNKCSFWTEPDFGISFRYKIENQSLVDTYRFDMYPYEVFIKKSKYVNGERITCTRISNLGNIIRVDKDQKEERYIIDNLDNIFNLEKRREENILIPQIENEVDKIEAKQAIKKLKKL